MKNNLGILFVLVVAIFPSIVFFGSCQRPNTMEEGDYVSTSNASDGAALAPAPEAEATAISDCEAIYRYENFVNRYIGLMKKASSGDMSSMQESLSLMQEAEAVGNEIVNAGEQLYSPECWNLFLNLQNRLINAAAEISNDYSAGGAQQDMNKMMNGAQKDVDRMMRDAQKDVDRMMRDAQRDVDNMMQDYN